MASVDLSSPFTFYHWHTTDAFVMWKNNYGDVIKENRTTGRCTLFPKKGKPNDYVENIRNFDTALDVLKQVRYKDFKEDASNETT